MSPMTTMFRSLKLATLALVVALGLVAGMMVYWTQPVSKAVFSATDITGVEWGRDFELVDHNGRRRTLADFRGKIVLVFFGYTNCPDACPTALAELAQVVQRLGADAERAQVLFITTDPARDTAERLKTYVTAFHPSFLGLRGTPEQTAQVAKDFKIYFEAEEPKGDGHAGHGSEARQYMVQHSTGILVFDRTGRLRLHIGANGRSVDDMVHDVKLLIAS